MMHSTAARVSRSLLNSSSNSSSKSICTPLFSSLSYSTASADVTTTHSYLKEEDASITPVNHTIGYQLSLNTRKAPFANAFRSTHQKINWSFADVKKHVEAFACGVVELGLRPGDRLALINGNNAEQLIAMNACAKAGATFVPLYNVKDEKEFHRCMELFRPRVLVVPAKLQKTDFYKILKTVFPALQKREDNNDPFTPVKSKKYPFLKNILITGANDRKHGTYGFHDVLVYGPFGYYENPLRRIAMDLTPEDPALILLDDKDINKAKPIVYSHKNLLNAGTVLATKLGLKQGDRVLLTQHLQSAFGAILANYSTMVSRATLIYGSEFFNAPDVLKAISAEEASVVFGTSSDFNLLLDVKDTGDLKFDHLKLIVVDESATIELIERIQRRFNVQRVVKLSGLDETSGLLNIDGALVPTSELKITRPHDGKVVHRNTNGDLKIRGPLVARGWWNDIGLMNPDMDEDGWFNTGKVASIDEKGNLSVY